MQSPAAHWLCSDSAMSTNQGPLAAGSNQDALHLSLLLDIRASLMRLETTMAGLVLDVQKLKGHVPEGKGSKPILLL